MRYNSPLPIAAIKITVIGFRGSFQFIVFDVHNRTYIWIKTVCLFSIKHGLECDHLWNYLDDSGGRDRLLQNYLAAINMVILTHCWNRNRDACNAAQPGWLILHIHRAVNIRET